MLTGRTLLPDNKIASLDGRRRRSERSKQAIIDAVVEMINEGELFPTAALVSQRAGVGLRTVFRHFSDMNTLFTLFNEDRRPHYRAMFEEGGDRTGALEKRIVALAEFRAVRWEDLTAVMRFSVAQRRRYKALADNYADYQHGLLEDLKTWLPELSQQEPVILEAVVGVCSFEYWDRLRDLQGLSVEEATGVVILCLRRLLLA
jgi:AcrR family transcriptional regulator